MAALLEFMYKGEVHVSQEALNSFLKSAESLQVRKRHYPAFQSTNPSLLYLSPSLSQVKGLSTETGRLAAQQAQQQHMGGDSSPLDSPTGRRSLRNSLSGSSGGGNGNGNSAIGGLGGASGGAIVGGMGHGNSLSHALSGMTAGGMAAAASVAASGLSALAASAGALDRCGSAGGNIISGSSAGIGPMSGGSVGGNGCGSGNGGNNGNISMGSGSGVALHLGGGGGGGVGGGIGSGNGNGGSGSGNGSTGSLKQECDSLMHASSSSALSQMGCHVPPMYHRPISFNEPLRKRALRSPYAEQELRGSVLRDGSKNSSECPSPINKPPYHRPSSSASSTAPTEADTMHSERASPQSR